MSKGVYRSWSLDPTAQQLTSSVGHDRNIAVEVVEVALAHTIALYRQRLIPGETACRLAAKLLELLENPSRLLEASRNLEDIHEGLEKLLQEELGAHADWFPLGRSRNDHVAAALRLYALKHLVRLYCNLVELRKALLEKAEAYALTPFPIHTHFQPAQWGTFGHWLHSYVEALEDVSSLLKTLLWIVARCPLGSGPGGGSTVVRDRLVYVELLGFNDLVYNTLYATGSRLFLNAVVVLIALLLSELSRLAADLVLLSHPLINLVKLPESHVSTSSAMPHKRNPVTAEAIRAKAAIAAGLAVAALGVSHGLPHGYNLDLQEANRVLYQVLGDANLVVEALTSLVKGLEPIEPRLPNAIVLWSMEVAEKTSVSRGVGFRRVYREVADAIRSTHNGGWEGISPPQPREIIMSRVALGSAGPGLQKALERSKKLLKEDLRFCKKLVEKLETARERLLVEARRVANSCH